MPQIMMLLSNVMFEGLLMLVFDVSSRFKLGGYCLVSCTAVCKHHEQDTGWTGKADHGPATK